MTGQDLTKLFYDLGFIHINQSIDESINIIDKARKGNRNVYKTKWLKFNRTLLGGLEPAKLYVIAGRPGSGKSAFSNQMIFDIIEENKNANLVFLYWNFEMPSYYQIFRSSSKSINKNLMELLSVDTFLADQDFINYTKAVSNYRQYPIYFYDIPKSINFIAKVNKLVKERDPEKQIINIFDHSRLVKNDKNIDEFTRLVELSHTCVEMQKEFNSTNILLSQLNRNIESEERKKSMYQPLLSDLFGADSIGQDADAVMIINRPFDMYGLTKPYLGLNPKGLMAVHIEKNRNGKLGMLPFNADLEHFTILER